MQQGVLFHAEMVFCGWIALTAPLLLQAAVVERLADVTLEQHRPGLLRTLQLCEKFINSNAASPAALQVLQEEVAKALTKQQQQQVGPWVIVGNIPIRQAACHGHSSIADPFVA